MLGELSVEQKAFHSDLTRRLEDAPGAHVGADDEDFLGRGAEARKRAVDALESVLAGDGAGKQPQAENLGTFLGTFEPQGRTAQKEGGTKGQQ